MGAIGLSRAFQHVHQHKGFRLSCCLWNRICVAMHVRTAHPPLHRVVVRSVSWKGDVVVSAWVSGGARSSDRKAPPVATHLFLFAPPSQIPLSHTLGDCHMSMCLFSRDDKSRECAS